MIAHQHISISLVFSDFFQIKTTHRALLGGSPKPSHRGHPWTLTQNRTLLAMISHTASITVSLFTSSDKVRGEETMAQALKWERASKKVKPGDFVKLKTGKG